MKIKSSVIFVFGTLLLLILSVVSNYIFSNMTLRSQNKERMLLFETAFKEKIKYETNILSSHLYLIQKRFDLKDAFISKERQQLMEAARGYFHNINKYNEITHFYFIDTDGKVFLRVHDPKRYADTIKRFTFLKAKEHMAPFSGLEFGLKRNFTLRVVHPWIVNGRLIGYIELGKEINKINEELSKITNIDIYYAVKKSLYKKVPSDIIEDSSALSHTKNYIIAYSTGSLPENLEKLYDENSKFSMVDIGDKHYLSNFSDLRDVSGEKIGKILYLIGVTFEIKEIKKFSLWFIIIIIIAASLVFFIVNITSRRHDKEIQFIMKNLEEQVKSRTKELRTKEAILYQQSKQAQMGEMISMIAHQWRQPLNAISASSIKLSLMSDLAALDSQKLKESTSFIQNECQKMSKIINTFTGFVKPEMQVKEFKLKHMVESVMQIMSAQLANHDIQVNINIKDENVSLSGHENMLEQVMINLLSNARDAFLQSDEENKQIIITIDKQGNSPLLSVEDNAGGIPENVQDKIFNPYFTTKEQGKGTGIGLYMSSEIITKSFHGNLTHRNTQHGSMFQILF